MGAELDQLSAHAARLHMSVVRPRLPRLKRCASALLALMLGCGGSEMRRGATPRVREIVVGQGGACLGVLEHEPEWYCWGEGHVWSTAVATEMSAFRGADSVSISGCILRRGLVDCVWPSAWSAPVPAPTGASRLAASFSSTCVAGHDAIWWARHGEFVLLDGVTSESGLSCAVHSAEGWASDGSWVSIRYTPEGTFERTIRLPPAAVRAPVVGNWLDGCGAAAGGGIICWGAAGSMAFTSSDDVVDLVGYPSMFGIASIMCARMAEGRVYCWEPEHRDVAKGSGAATPSTDGPDCSSGAGGARATREPREIPLPAPARAVGAGTRFACALLVDDSVWCWGANNVGQLGDGTHVDSELPVPVVGLGG